MLNGESAQHRLSAFARLKCCDWTCVISIDDRLYWAIHASYRDHFAVVIDVLGVSSWRDENEIAVVGDVDRLLNRWLIGWNVNDRRSSGPGEQTEHSNNESAFRIEQFGVMHSDFSGARTSAIFGEATTAAILITLRRRCQDKTLRVRKTRCSN